MPETCINHGTRDSMHETSVGIFLKRISWSAVFAGVITALMIHIILALFGTAIGATTIDLQQEQNTLQHFGIGALVWTALNMLLAIVAGSYVAGRLAQHEGALHGLLMFGVSTILTIWLAVSLASSLISGAFNIIGNSANALSQSLSAIAPPITNMMQEKLHNANLDDLQNTLQTILHPDKSELQSEKLQQIKQQAEQKARETADQAADATAKMSWYAFFMLLIEAVLAAVMGRIGLHNQPHQKVKS